MAVVESWIQKGTDGTLCFGNYKLQKRTKLSDFEQEGYLYKRKTFKEITTLEQFGLFLYESVEGTAVTGFKATENSVSLKVEGMEDAQITLGLEPETEYTVSLDGSNVGVIKTNLSGKLMLSVELDQDQQRLVEAVKVS